jgi:hypothetical protein
MVTIDTAVITPNPTIPTGEPESAVREGVALDFVVEGGLGEGG